MSSYRLSYVKRARIRELLKEVGVKKTTTDFYHVLDQAVSRVLVRMIIDMARVYPNKRADPELLQLLSNMEGRYELDFVVNVVESINPNLSQAEIADLDDVEEDEDEWD